MSFDSKSLTANFIRENSSYGGIRVELEAKLVGVKRGLPVQIDIGFGDKITPHAEVQLLSTILDFPPPKLIAYNAETVIAEKFEAMVSLGIANTRLKDFFDVYTLFSNQSINLDMQRLNTAIQNTFKRRKTILNDTEPVAFSPEYYANESINNTWKSFCRRNNIVDYPDFKEVVTIIKENLLPIYKTIH